MKGKGEEKSKGKGNSKKGKGERQGGEKGKVERERVILGTPEGTGNLEGKQKGKVEKKGRGTKGRGRQRIDGGLADIKVKERGIYGREGLELFTST